MEKSNLVQILQTFSGSEWRDFEKWLRSPAHNTRADVLQLFRYLRKSLSAAEPLGTGVVSRAVIPAQAQNNDHLHHLKSYLMKSLEDFLLWSAWSADVVGRQQMLAAVFRQRSLGKLARRARRLATELQVAAPMRGHDFFEKQARLEIENIRLAELENTVQSHDLQPLLDAQEVRFIVEKLQAGCLLLSQQAVSPRPYDSGLLASLVAFLANHRYLGIPAVSLYYYGYLAQLEPEEDGHFRRLKALLTEHSPLFRGEELRNLYLLAINFCIRRLNRLERGYLREAFELYQSGLIAGAFLQNGQLSRFTYTNIAQAGMGLGEFDWVAGFLEKYKKYLAPELREPVSQFNLARLYYETGRPDAAMRCLLNIEHDDIIHNLAAKTLLARIYYEQGELNALDSLLDSIAVYIRRKKVLGYHRDSYLSFVKILRLTAALDLTRAGNRAEVREKIAGMKVLAEREWLAGLVAR